MGYLAGEDREQVRYFSMEDCIPEECLVRVIDRFIEIQDFAALGFTNAEPAELGRPSYPPKALAKLYVYGYENSVRSSRKLECEARRNLEAIWLLNNLKPDYKTIAEFRKDNIRPLQKLFKEFVKLCKHWDMIGGELIAVDGTKIRASNNKKNNFSRKKLDERIARLDKQIDEYLKKLDENDIAEQKSEIDTKKVLEELNERKEKYENYIKTLDETGENEISEVDPDARLMVSKKGGVDVCYNVQSAVDAKKHIIVDYDVTNSPTDHGQLSKMAKKVKKSLKLKKFTAIADKGYYVGGDLARCKKYKIRTIVSKQNPSNPKDQPEEFHTDKFVYNEKTDTYTCPTGKILPPHNKKSAKRRNFHNKTACAECPHREKCAAGNCGFRTVTRGQYSKICDEVDQRTRENMATYRLRKQIVEHPFGTVKHAMNGGYFLLRTRRKVRTEIALLFLGYNLKRAYNCLGFKGIMAKLDEISAQNSAFLRLIFRKFGICGKLSTISRFLLSFPLHGDALPGIL